MRGPRPRSFRVPLAVLALAGLAAPTLRAAPRRPAELDQPLAVALGDGRLLAVRALPGILARPEVKPHLTTGLTTSFVLRAEAADGRGGKARGGARVDVRYELWDEVFLVSAMGIDGRVRRETLPSFERLLAWWRGLELPALPAARLDPVGPWQVEVAVSVLPFSQSEQREAQRWFSESVGAAQGSNAEELSAAAKERGEGFAGVLDLLVATSIKRRSLVRYDWTLTFRPERTR